MRWEAGKHHPTGLRVLVDGEPVRKVRAFDTDEGWVRVLCLEDHTGFGGCVHLDPEDPRQVCARTLRGVVTLEPMRTKPREGKTRAE